MPQSCLFWRQKHLPNQVIIWADIRFNFFALGANYKIAKITSFRGSKKKTLALLIFYDAIYVRTDEINSNTFTGNKLTEGLANFVDVVSKAYQLLNKIMWKWILYMSLWPTFGMRWFVCVLCAFGSRCVTFVRLCARLSSFDASVCLLDIIYIYSAQSRSIHTKPIQRTLEYNENIQQYTTARASHDRRKRCGTIIIDKGYFSVVFFSLS